MTLHDASDQLQGTLPTDGTATPLSFATPCYRAGRTFVGAVGQRVSLEASTRPSNPSGALGLMPTSILKPAQVPRIGPDLYFERRALDGKIST